MANLDIHINTTKKLAAHRQIDAAIAHIQKAELECAIILAAAAEGLLPDTDEPYIFGYLQNHPSYKNKEVDYNVTINWLKHAPGPDAQVIFEFEAAVVIARAMSKFFAVYSLIPTEWDQFLSWAVARGHWSRDGVTSRPLRSGPS